MPYPSYHQFTTTTIVFGAHYPQVQKLYPPVIKRSNGQFAIYRGFPSDRHV